MLIRFPTVTTRSAGRVRRHPSISDGPAVPIADVRVHIVHVVCARVICYDETSTPPSVYAAPYSYLYGSYVTPHAVCRFTIFSTEYASVQTVWKSSPLIDRRKIIVKKNNDYNIKGRRRVGHETHRASFGLFISNVRPDRAVVFIPTIILRLLRGL